MMKYAIYFSRTFYKSCPVKQWFVTKWNQQPKLTLGRWNMDDCNKKIDAKVDWANEDHCGPCGNHEIKGSAPAAPLEKVKTKN